MVDRGFANISPDTARLLPRLIAGRQRGPLFLSEYRPGPHRRATTDPRDICPETSRTRLGYDRARILIGQYADGLELHQLRHSAATHLGDANTSANVIMTKTGHKSLRSVQRYVQPGLPPCTRPPRRCPAHDVGDDRFTAAGFRRADLLSW